MDIQPVFSILNASILLGGAFSFFIVSQRYPSAIRRALNLHASANVAIAAGAMTDVLATSTPALSQAFAVETGGLGTALYYLAYRSLQERTYHLRMVIPLYALFLVAAAYAYGILNSANIGIFSVCVLDTILFGLAARDLLLNFNGRGRAHLIQGIGLALFSVLVLIWGGGFLMEPTTPVYKIQPGDGLVIGFVGNCFAAAFGATNFLLMCNDEFNARLQTLIGTDPLTGIANRRKLMERGEEEVARAHRYGHPLTVVMIDLDHFKALNDTFGHAAGDRALRDAAQACEAALRDIDLVSRSGGEEFAILLPQTPLVQGLEVAERLRQAVEQIDLQWGTAKVPVTASLGVAELHPEDASIDQVIARADRALYRSKAEGRNRVSHQILDGSELLAAAATV